LGLEKECATGMQILETGYKVKHVSDSDDDDDDAGLI